MLQRVRASDRFWTDTRVGEFIAQRDELDCPRRIWQTKDFVFPIVQERHSVHERSSVELFRRDSIHGLTICLRLPTEHLEEVVPVQRSETIAEIEFQFLELVLEHHGA